MSRCPLKPPISKAQVDLPVVGSFETSNTWLDALLTHTQLAHHIKGRVRLKLGAASTASLQSMAQNGLHQQTFSWADGQKLLGTLKRLPGVLDISVNVMARSATVMYDPKVIPDVAWTDLIAGLNTSSSQLLRDMLLGISISNSTTNS